MLFSFVEVVGITVVYSLYTSSPLAQERSETSLACDTYPLRGKPLGFFRGRIILKRLRLAALARSQRRFRVLTTALRHQLMAETRTTGQTHSQLTTLQVAGAFQFCDPLPRYSDLSRSRERELSYFWRHARVVPKRNAQHHVVVFFSWQNRGTLLAFCQVADPRRL